ncbi:MAG: class I SAM-dependent methyltransferase [Clostridium sp.]|uniref:class I SAM-dependent methyltransferase n=1 Tax=Clostridium sp. DSM 8431 TaxID=1761781 RepID=UPI0008F445E9|nr:class I SAM-dependent methyltransferase [Clostridium sp. DSM 8431]MCR4944337.1 class I SAM-dependent methyltransferase [Clostridium sp.]SFU32452.1 Methyltransferase domain-containing protein [Clostridium sp. DSM 8431]
MEKKVDFSKFSNGSRLFSFEEEGDFFIPYIKDNMKILDLGCGNGEFTIFLSKLAAKGNVIGIDNNGEQIDTAKVNADKNKISNMKFLEADVYNLPFEDCTFDFVSMNMLLTYIDKPISALKEAFRVLKKGGIIAVNDPDYDGNIMAPNYQIISQRMAINEKLMRDNGINMRSGKYNAKLLNEVGFINVKPSVKIKSYGSKEEAQEFSKHMNEIENLFFSSDASDMAKNMRKESWRCWMENQGAFAARTYCRVVGWKDEN